MASLSCRPGRLRTILAGKSERCSWRVIPRSRTVGIGNIQRGVRVKNLGPIIVHGDSRPIFPHVHLPSPRTEFKSHRASLILRIRHACSVAPAVRVRTIRVLRQIVPIGQLNLTWAALLARRRAPATARTTAASGPSPTARACTRVPRTGSYANSTSTTAPATIAAPKSSRSADSARQTQPLVATRIRIRTGTPA